MDMKGKERDDGRGNKEIEKCFDVVASAELFGKSSLR
jgi:hypothetical protein